MEISVDFSRRILAHPYRQVIDMKFFTKKRRKVLSALVAAGFLLGTSPQFVVYAAGDSGQTEQKSDDGKAGDAGKGADTSKDTGSGNQSSSSNNDAMQQFALQGLMTSGFGGIPIPGTSAKYMPIPGMRIKAVPVCYINPSKPELNQKVTVVCALTNLKKGTKVTSTSPMSLYNMAANAITKSVSPVIVQQIEMSDATEKLMFSWTLEQAVKDQAGNKLNPLTDTAYASVTITAYEGSNGLGDDNNGADDTGGVSITGNTGTKQCNNDGTVCYTTTCSTNGDCTTTCEGSGCPDDGTGSTGFTTNDKCQIGYTLSDDGYCVRVG